MYTFRERARIVIKWLGSLRRSTWEFADYPICVRPNADSGFAVADPRFAWYAQFLNWPGPTGLGPTPELAREDLKANFEKMRQYRTGHGERMPRPGVREPIRFVTSVRVTSNPQLLADFLVRILAFSPSDRVLVSDESSLHDFSLGNDAELARLRGLVQATYGVDTSDLDQAKLVDILERIEKHGADGLGPR